MTPQPHPLPPPPPSPLRRQAWRSTVLLVSLVFGGLLAWVAWVGPLDAVHGLRVGRSLVTASARDAMAVPFVGVFVALAGLAFAPDPDQGRSHRRHGHSPRVPAARKITWAGVCLGVGAVCFVAALLAPPVAYVLLQRLAARQGYARCPPLEWEHHPQLRWRRTHAGPGVDAPPCPRTWQEAEAQADRAG